MVTTIGVAALEEKTVNSVPGLFLAARLDWAPMTFTYRLQGH